MGNSHCTSTVHEPACETLSLLDILNFLCEVSKLNLTTNISVSLSGGSGVVIQGTKLFLKSQWNNVTGAPGVLDIDNRQAD